MERETLSSREVSTRHPEESVDVVNVREICGVIPQAAAGPAVGDLTRLLALLFDIGKQSSDCATNLERRSRVHL